MWEKCEKTYLNFQLTKDYVFEIQVRTALEHAWAEIEHDRGYKLGGKLPSHLNRRFKLLSGLLESADLEFNRLTVEIENYAKELDLNIENNTLEFELTTIGINSLLDGKYSIYVQRSDVDNDFMISDVIEELENFGIKTLKNLDNIISPLEGFYKFSTQNTYVGFLRDAMLMTDMEKYFKDSYSKSNNKWSENDQAGFDFLLQKYSKDEIIQIHSKYGVRFENSDVK